MATWLIRQGYTVNSTRVARLMRTMGLWGITPKKKLRIPNKGRKVYPYVKGTDVASSNQVFGADITRFP